MAGIGPNSDIPAVLIAPPAGGTVEEYRVYLETDQNVPWVGATVELVFPPEACDLLVLCDFVYSDCPHTYAETTDASGVAHFFITGGGCWGEGRIGGGGTWVDETLAGGYLVSVLVNSERVATRGVRSADAVHNVPNGPVLRSWELWCEAPPSVAGQVVIGLGDLLAHTNPFRYGDYSPCSDIDGDGDISIEDVLKATRALKFGGSCDEPTE